MTRPITSEHLATLAVAVDNAAEARGWNEGPLLVKVESAPPPDFLELGMKEIEGHPLDTLLGFTAPPEWQALGVCSEGWMAPMGSGKRPSQSKGRMRMRTTAIMSRADAVVVSGVRKAGEDFELMPDGECVGMIPDALRRALGLPTPLPELPFTHWVAVMLFGLIIGDGGKHRRVGWAQLRPKLESYEAVGNEGTWDFMRKLATKRSDVQVDLSPDVAAWMDEGIFARWVVGGLPPYDALLEDARRVCTPEAFSQLRRLLRRWGLRTRVQRAA